MSTTTPLPPPTDAHMRRLLTTHLAAAETLLQQVEAASSGTTQALVRDRLRASVVRPLAEQVAALQPTASSEGASNPRSSTTEGPTPEQLDQSVWELALSFTRLLATAALPARVSEAAATLIDLSVRGPHLSAVPDTSARRAELAEVLASIQPQVRVEDNGPYLVTSVEALDDWLGQPLGLAPHVALCRCGASRLKPLCDGSHAGIGFSGAKDAARIADRRDVYPGVSLTVLDNRGICAHSGLCTDRLSSVFHVDGDPFITPGGGRMDEIIRAVRECPSGALSFAVDDREARQEVDRTDRGPAIEVSRDGPYRMSGRIRLVGDDGATDVVRNQGASLEHYSLCRCGQSRNKPFCSGRHWEVHFSDPIMDADTPPTLFQWAGGLPALRRLTRRFYETHVPSDALLAPLFAQMTPDHPERVATWLAEVFGGPKGYTDHYGGYPHMVSEHMGAHLTEAQRARFVELLCRSADDVRLPADAEFRAAFVAYLEWGSRIAVENSQPGASPPAKLAVPRWWWVCDATPAARVSALAPAEADSEPELPGPDTAVSFSRHIKALFRAADRESMRFAFDLWSHADVAEHKLAILSRLEAGSMPCDGAWPAARIEVFKRWLQSGAPE